MDWPSSADYGEAVQNLKHSMGDGELCSGEAKTDFLGLPMLWAGGFANVCKIHNAKTGKTWALKCFTRKVTGQTDRYRQISEHLQKAKLPFMVDFTYLSQGVRVRGEWFPALKMRWVEGGIRLNEFVKEYLDRPKMLRDLLRLWPKMAIRLRRKKITHAELQKLVMFCTRDGDLMFVTSSDGVKWSEPELLLKDVTGGDTSLTRKQTATTSIIIKMMLFGEGNSTLGDRNSGNFVELAGNGWYFGGAGGTRQAKSMSSRLHKILNWSGLGRTTLR